MDQPSVALVLQGGGAMGAYQIGAYEALVDAGFVPDWVCGISIGAFNAAVIAGNPPHHRLEKLTALWDAISWPDVGAPSLFAPSLFSAGLFSAGLFTPLRLLHNMASYGEALWLGQPNFFAPRPVNPYLVPSAPTQNVSFYDTSKMLETLRRFAAFPISGSDTVRLSVGATKVATGELRYFDTGGKAPRTIEANHVLASGSLPPWFGATLVDGDPYWDGACVSNTPIEYIAGERHRRHTIAFVIDLWDPIGPLPTTIPEVQWRAKQIQYSSQNHAGVDAAARTVRLRHAMRRLNNSPGESHRMDIVHVIYKGGPDQTLTSDAEFSRDSIAERREAGFRDLSAAIAESPWLLPGRDEHLGAFVHRVENGAVDTVPPAEV